MKKSPVHADNFDKQVGNYVRPQVTKLLMEWTVGDALDEIRKQDYNDEIVYFYAVDSNDRLLGVVPVRRLLTSAMNAHVSEIMIENVVTVPSSATLLDAAELMLKHHLMALPVIDNNGILKGVIDLTLFTDEFSFMLHEKKDDRAFQLIGVHVAFARTRSPWTRYKDRFPWLLCNVTGGIICALIASFYESLISLVTMLAMFMPVVLTLAESVSMQSMTLSIQAIAHGKNRWALLWRSVRRELVTSLLLGISCGFLVGIIAYLWKGSMSASISVAASITLSIIIACLLGVLIPGIVRGFRFDPKVASGPIVLAIADILTLVFYFTLATHLLS